MVNKDGYTKINAWMTDMEGNQVEPTGNYQDPNYPGNNGLKGANSDLMDGVEESSMSLSEGVVVFLGLIGFLCVLLFGFCCFFRLRRWVKNKMLPNKIEDSNHENGDVPEEDPKTNRELLDAMKLANEMQTNRDNNHETFRTSK